MDDYISAWGWHFNKKLCKFAVKHMRRKNRNTGESEKFEPWEREKVEELLKKHNIELENLTSHDHVYVANMALSDFFKGSIPDEAHLALYIKEVVDDDDQADGFIMNRFYADCVRKGLPIPWDDVL